MCDVEFNELFDSKRQAVVCYLSIERNYLSALKQLREKTTETDKIIDMGYWRYQQEGTSSK